MRTRTFICIVGSLALCSAFSSPAISAPQSLGHMMTSANLVRAQHLQREISDKRRELSIERQKRNLRIDGVHPDVLESMNRRQDSICLALESELVFLEMQYAELEPQLPPKIDFSDPPSSPLPPRTVQ